MKLTPEAIIKIVVDYFKVPLELVLSTCRKGEYIKARQVSMYFMKIYIKKISLAKIGTYFNGKEKFKNHATVLFSIRAVKNNMETNKCYKLDIENIDKKINSDNVFVVIEVKSAVDIRESVLVHENYYLKSEIVRLKNEVSALHGTIYGLKLNKRKLKRRTKKPALLKLSDIKPVPISNSISCQFVSPYAGMISCNNQGIHGYREHQL